jgi:hypothetical protein
MRKYQEKAVLPFNLEESSTDSLFDNTPDLIESEKLSLNSLISTYNVRICDVVNYEDRTNFILDLASNENQTLIEQLIASHKSRRYRIITVNHPLPVKL